MPTLRVESGLPLWWATRQRRSRGESAYGMRCHELVSGCRAPLTQMGPVNEHYAREPSRNPCKA